MATDGYSKDLIKTCAYLYILALLSIVLPTLRPSLPTLCPKLTVYDFDNISRSRLLIFTTVPTTALN